MTPPAATAAARTAPTEPLSDQFDALFRAHSSLVYRTAYSITGNSQDAEDIVQALFLRLLARGIPAGVHDNPAAYLYRAAVNSALNAVKREHRKASLHAVADASLAVAASDPRGGGSDAESRRRLLDAVRQLSRRSVEILILRYAHDLAEADIARLLGTSRGVVAVTLFRAHRRLRKLMSAGELK